jgi:hypothetical protein
MLVKLVMLSRLLTVTCTAAAAAAHRAISSSVGGSWRVRASQLRHSAGTVLGSYSRSLPAAAAAAVRTGGEGGRRLDVF